MGILIEELERKFQEQEPPLGALAGIRQEVDLDPITELAFEDADEEDKHIAERLDAREGEALMDLNVGRFPFPVSINQMAQAWPNRTPEQREAQLQYQIQTAAEAVEKFVLGDLLLKASKRNPAEYLERAYFYLGDPKTGKPGDAEKTLKKAVNSVLGMGQDPPKLAQVSNTLQTALPTQGTYERSEYNPERPSKTIEEEVDFYTGAWWK